VDAWLKKLASESSAKSMSVTASPGDDLINWLEEILKFGRV
jgi:hypothetical protein